MSTLRPITAAEFDAWLQDAIPAFAADKVASGEWREDTALEQSRKAHSDLLPDGIDTKDNYLYAILGEEGQQVGFLWFAVRPRGRGSIAYVYSVDVWPRHRRQGHAHRAFIELESEVARLGLDGIALHVFGHNKIGRALYAKLGYEPTNINLYKPVGLGSQDAR
jgi:ribosomal protein S18 acetylase RimI-like enzyme